ncbi:hypothetical protein [Burkholderia cenocepacia]|uniref:hypothetical protein n=1 Tax=Burkholderia cenocepacia TaxID=95486 RepID=UPI0024B6F575|nr:hypothetical protein [Burkholderia cenocepacia]MDI9689785.1 hypothetical protein [Burkholderia cenocepacia]
MPLWQWIHLINKPTAADKTTGTGRCRLLLRARRLAVRDTWQREGEVRNLVMEHVEDLTPLLGRLATSSRDFH